MNQHTQANKNTFFPLTRYSHSLPPPPSLSLSLSSLSLSLSTRYAGIPQHQLPSNTPTTTYVHMCNYTGQPYTLRYTSMWSVLNKCYAAAILAVLSVSLSDQAVVILIAPFQHACLEYAYFRAGTNSVLLL